MNTPTTLPDAWWQLGTLHDKTLGDWLVAEMPNRMATALDMLVAIQEDLGAVVTLGSRDDLMRHVLEMTGCLDAIASQQAEPASVSVSRAALAAAQALGYLPLAEAPPAETEFH